MVEWLAGRCGGSVGAGELPKQSPQAPLLQRGEKEGLPRRAVASRGGAIPGFAPAAKVRPQFPPLQKGGEGGLAGSLAGAAALG